MLRTSSAINLIPQINKSIVPLIPMSPTLTNNDNKKTVIVVRHGKSIWNRQEKFTGWTDIPLDHYGYIEARKIGEKLKELNLIPGIVFTSALKRSIETANNINKVLQKNNLQIHISWRLNEKHYGTLEGVPRNDIEKLFGNDFLRIMRSNFRMKPPILSDSYINTEQHNFKTYKNCYFEQIKLGESKEDVLNRFLPYYQNDILYYLKEENKIPLIVTHKHTARVLMKHLIKIPDIEFDNFKLPDQSLIVIKLNDNYEYKSHENIKYID